MATERICRVCGNTLKSTERHEINEDICSPCYFGSSEPSVNVDVPESHPLEVPPQESNSESEPTGDWNPMQRPWQEFEYLPLLPFEKRAYYFLRTLIWPGSSWFFGISVWGIALNVWKIPFLITGGIVGGVFAIICALVASRSRSDTDFYAMKKGFSMLFTPPAVGLFILALIAWGIRKLI
ncbi:hypothetical protein M1N56_05385 [Dehalococcoidia bacterium]|nr:hypothetical protein [Dehalococcoidia bacterium]